MILLVHFLCCAFMLGVIFYVQLVHYPSFLRITEDRFKDFHQFHTRQTGYVVAPVMLLELSSGAILVMLSPSWPFVLNSVGIVLIWLSTFLIQVPSHHKLAKGIDLAEIRKLLRWNWIRCFLWLARSFLLLLMLA